ncbi:MAG: SRPBCC family protein, partial [Bdellovibrionales bacterium]|nr:SRPBCC family protein [Bdellovibrionales bacterium]
STELPLPIEQVFPFFAEAENLERITPPQLSFRIESPVPIVMREGTEIDYRLSLFGFPFRWKSLISVWRPPFEFVDEQVSGPYALWRHLHRFSRTGDGATLMEDRVEYQLPLAPLGNLALPLVRLQLDRIFAYRNKVILQLLTVPAITPHPEIQESRTEE